MVKAYFGLGVLLYLQFFLVYGVTNWLAAQRNDWYAIYFDWELSIPFVPQFIYVYLSLSLFLILPLFYLNRTMLPRWATSYMWLTFIAGVLFLVFPATPGVARPLDMIEQSLLFEILYRLDLPHNMFPSLHVAYITLALLIIRSCGERDGKLWLITGWWFLMVLSVLLVHQHHLADIFGGFLLAIGCYRFVYLAGSEKSARKTVSEC